MKIEFITNSPEETYNLGATLGKKLKPGAILAFYGDLAAGKTTLIKGIADALGGIESAEVNSPTFTYLNIYQGLQSLYHFDLYRMRNQDEFLQMGFDEYFDAEGVCCIEWAERTKAILPKKRLDISIEQLPSSRKIVIESHHDEINF